MSVKIKLSYGCNILQSLATRKCVLLQKTRQIASVSTLQAHLDHGNKALVIQSGEKLHQTLKFPYVWLRDNCQCKMCYHPVSRQRLFLLRHLDPGVAPNETKVTETGDISVTWPDNHVSVFEMNWLKERLFSPDDNNKRLAHLSRTPNLWNADLQAKIPRIDFNELITNKKTLYDWLVDMEEIGLTLITGAPTQTGVCREIGDKVAFLKTTSYGQTFVVKSKADPSSIAYTSATLGLHTDLPQYHYSPGVQMLHCITQAATQGGDNVFSDAFYAANVLQKEYPHYYKILTTVSVDYQDVGTDSYKFHMLMRAPVIELDSSGVPVKINYNNQVRDSVLNLPFEDVQPLYEALCKMEEILNDKKNSVHHKLKEGEIVCFHNYRVLHGRGGYRLLEGGERHLEGGYLDWDEMKSRRRVLQEELGDQL